MSESRYLIRLSHEGRQSPADIPAFFRRLQDLLHTHAARPAHLRISTVACEFDLYVESTPALDSSLALLPTLGQVLTCRLLSNEPASGTLQDALVEARHFFNEQRFWEVHEVLEDVWKRAEGAEKVGLQGLILVAAALVHGQRNEPSVMVDMLRDARPRLDHLPDVYQGWRVADFKAQVERWAEGQKSPFPTTKDFVC